MTYAAYLDGSLYDGSKKFSCPIDSDKYKIFSYDGSVGLNIIDIYNAFSIEKPPRGNRRDGSIEYLYMLILHIHYTFNPLTIKVDARHKFSGANTMLATIDKMYENGEFDGIPISHVDSDILKHVKEHRTHMLTRSGTNFKPYVIRSKERICTDPELAKICLATIHSLSNMNKGACVAAIVEATNLDETSSLWMLEIILNDI